MGNEELSSNGKETADVLNNYFTSVFEQESDQELSNFEELTYNKVLENIVISEEPAAKVIKQVKPSKSHGPDMIHPKSIGEDQYSLTKPITIIYKNHLRNAKSQKCGNVQTHRSSLKVKIEPNPIIIG